MSQESIYGRDYLQKFIKLEAIKATWELNKWRATKTAVTVDDSTQLVIDVGCACGTFIKSFKNIYPTIRTIGVDINPLAVAECTFNGIEAYTQEMFSYLWEDNLSKFNNTIMTFWDSLEHMRDPIAFLKKYSPKNVIVSLPCLDAFLENYTSFDIILWKHYRPMEHLWHFTIDQFQNFMESAGYRVIRGPLFEESYWRADPLLKERNIMTFSFERA